MARKIGIEDVIAYILREKLEAISEENAVRLVGELLKKRRKILGYANSLLVPSEATYTKEGA